MSTNLNTALGNNLTDKVAFVTGGARGIGAAIVRRLASQGAAVAFTYQQSAAGAEALAGRTSRGEPRSENSDGDE